jgi:Cu(I)/Ag(I) efflux system membrane fusion protein
MTRQTDNPGSRRRLVTSIALVVALLVAAFVLRRPLVAWFTGTGVGSEGKPADVVAGPTVGSPGLLVGNSSNASAPGEMASAGRAPAGTRGEIDHYTCSMHPSVKQKAPGTCPICGMDLIAVTKEQQEQGVVMIDEARRQLIGVRTAPVIEGPMCDTFRAVGRVAYDESALTDVNLKVRGWITQLLVSQTGQRVARGQTLFTMYSPELYNAQQDFLLATHGATAPAMSSPDAASPRNEAFGRAARQRLRLLGMGEAQIDAIAKNGAPMESVAVPSPASGFVIEKNVVEGAAVDAGMRLYRIAALNKVWVEAEVYEADLARVRTGQPVKVTLDYLPGRAYDAKVAYVYPYLDSKARTGRVRVEIANKELDLRPGMYASVELGADMGTRIQVPAAAVVYTGPRRLVFIDLGQGRFKPQEIQVGTEANGMFAVLSGLKPGDLVATSGVFLIAAEARISTAAKYWESSTESDDGR